MKMHQHIRCYITLLLMFIYLRLIGHATLYAIHNYVRECLRLHLFIRFQRLI